MATTTEREENKEEMQPLTVKQDIDMIVLHEMKSIDDAEILNDPLVGQLPKAMLKYIQTPKANQMKVNFVSRSGCNQICHNICSILGGLLCCYSCCRMIVVEKGEIALTQYGDEQEIYSQGRHVLLAPWNKLIEKKQLIDPVIKHGTIHIIKVQSGQLGYGINMASGHPVLLTQGEHIIDSDTFKWIRFITLRERKTMLGNLTIIRIETGYVGYCYKQGQLVILKPGLHLIQPPDRFEFMRHEFMLQLHAFMQQLRGIEIENIRIESLKIADSKLKTNISSQAIKVFDTHNRYMLLMKQQEIVTVQAETEARKIRIDTNAEAQKIRTKAQAKADAIVIEAEAKKKAKELEGQGESEYSRLLESTKLGTTLAAMKLQADSIKGLKQIAYVPHLPALLNKGGVFANEQILMPHHNDNQ